MQDILTCAMGLDVHRDIIVACLVKGAVDAEPEAETRTFSTLIPEMQKLRDWVIESECRNIAMESTGIYWQPIYEMLESCFDGEISILVVNARHMKNVPGRKTDMKDAQWIATLLTISYPPSGAGRMMAGLRTPTCMMLSMVCCMSSSSVTLKGWFLKGRISDSGICCTCSLGFCFGTVASPPENAKAAGGGLRLR